MSKHQNSHVNYSTSFKDALRIGKTMLTTQRVDRFPRDALPVQAITAQSLREDNLLHPEQDTLVYRLGHSSLLLRLQGEYVLLDPVLSLRASPSQLFGPKRYHDAPISIADLPPLKTIVISHDHYDHLDKAAIKALDNKVETYVMPTGVGNHLRRWGISDDKITELAWWQGVQIGNTSFSATPAQHFSGRGITDKDKTLWASFVIQGLHDRLFFSGDSGYFPGFKEIGQEFGGFDLTMIETGAYNDMWQAIHMLPEESVQAHIDVKGAIMMPIHNSTFDLALHPWYEPLERAHMVAQSQEVKLATPIIGAAFNINSQPTQQAWWREYASIANLQPSMV